MKCTGNPCVGTLYWTGTGSGPLAESNGGTFTEEYAFFNGKRVARRDLPGGTVNYYFSDHLGSASVITNSAGSIQKESDYYPFGGEMVVSGSDINNYKFTGKERDAESGLDDFGARYYGSSTGRFMSPDWAERATAVPYATLASPQSLNLFSYVSDNPLGRTDPDGHRCAPAGSICDNAKGLSSDAQAAENQYLAMVAQSTQEAQNQAQNNSGQVTAKVKGKTVTYTYPDGSKVVLKGTHAWRDNNPGDLKSGYGSIGRDGRGKKAFAIYESAADGWNALGQTLTSKYGDSTIADTMKHFAPASDSNNPVKYAATLAESVGVPVSTKISALSPAQFTTVEINIGVAEGYFAPKNTEAYSAPSQ